MAIIYSYPDNLNILLTDMLIGTSTVRVAGKKKNITKNFTVEALGKVISDDNPTVWGTIIGNLSDQTDLQLALDSKQNNITLTTIGSNGPSTLIGSILNIPNYVAIEVTRTSELINDGEDGVHPFITAEDIPAQVNSDWNATSGVAEILNKPTKTSDFTNDGADGINPFITAQDIPTTLIFTSPLVNTAGTVTINQSGSTTDGYLGSIDWNTFNNKQEALLGTGFVKSTAGVISYDTNTYYLASNPDGFITSAALIGYVPYTGATGPVNLGSYDLTVNGLTVGKGGGNMSSNTVTGQGAGQGNTTGIGNSFFGQGAGQNNTTANANSFFGFSAGQANRTGALNTFIGGNAGSANTTGSGNIFVGVNAGNYNVSGTNSVVLGYNSNVSENNETNQIVIGANTVGLGSNTTVLGNSSITKAIIYGNLGLGTTAPSQKLHVVGSARITGAIYDSSNDAGTLGQVLSSTATGTDWVTLTDMGLTSVGLSMPVAFTVANTPLTANGTIAVSAAGLASQYIRGDGQLATFPTSGGGGSSVNYYLNGSIPSSVAGYQQMDNEAIIGGGTDFNLTGNGLIAQFLTDIGNPNRIEIPGGAWNFEMFFNISSVGGNTKFYVDLLKYDGSTFTLISSGSTNPEEITGGTSIDLYLTSLAVPTTPLLTTDRLAVRVYIVDNSGGRTATLHTEDNNLCEVLTTFSGGVTSLNGLTANTQYLAVGTSGTDFNISSVLDTHTFNLPTASSTNRGALSSSDWITFNSKANASGTTNYVSKFTGASSLGNSLIYDDGYNVGIGTIEIIPVLSPVERVLKIQSIGASSLYLTTEDFNRNWAITAGSSGKLLFTDINYGFSRMTIDSSGNVGINVLSNLVERLEVGGNALIKTAFIGTISAFGDNYASFSQTSRAGTSDYSLLSENNGATYLNASLVQSIKFRIGNFDKAIIDSNGNFGIGTTIPTQKLHVEGNLKVTGTILDSNNSAGTLGQILSSTSTGTDWVTLSEIAGVDGTGTANYVSKWLDGNTITNSSIYDNGTNVGIGTSSIGNSRLNILNISSNPFLSLRDTSNVYEIMSMTFDQSTDMFSITNKQAYSESGISFGTNNTEKMRINVLGNVGIGTSSPGAKLDVAGRFIASGTDFHTLSVQDGSAQLKLERTNSSAGLMYLGADNVGFKVFDSSFNTRLTVTQAGDVGIGTTNPVTASGYTGLTVYNSINGGIIQSTNGTVDVRMQLSSTAGYLGTFSNHDLVLNSNGEKMRITSSGNVGIGTTNPAYKLDVAGDIRLSTNSNPRLVLFNTSTNGKNWSMYSADAGNLIIGRTGIADYFTILDGGNVGIGTSSPAEKLEVIGKLRVSNGGSPLYYAELVGQYAASPGYLAFRGAGGAGMVISSEVYGNETALWSNDTEKIRINAAGNVGIGTTSPGAKLSVSGVSGGTSISTDNSSAYSILYSTISGASPIAFDNTNGALSVYTGGGERMRITSGGNLLIGTTTDAGNRLEVVGTANNWAGSFTGNTTTGQSYGAIVRGGTNSSDVAFNVNNAANSTTYLNVRGDGNVGIGTTSPSVAAGLGLVLNGQAGQTRLAFKNNYTGDTSSDGVQFALIAGSSGFVFQNRESDGYFSFETNGNEVFRTIGTNVGIGTTVDSGYKLDVSGRGRFITSSGEALTINAASGEWGQRTTGSTTPGGSYGSLIAAGTNSSDYSMIAFNQNMSQTYFSIRGDGNVGIGTTSPVVNLQVTNISGELFRLTNTTGIERLHFYTRNTASTTRLGSQNAALQLFTEDVGFDLMLGTANTERMRITNSGNVGIGTSSPATKLEVAGNIKSTLSGYELQMYPAWDTGVAGFGTSSNHGLVLSTNSAERMRITSGGEIWFKGVSTSTGYEGVITNTETTFDIYGSRYGGTGKALTFWATGASESMRITSGGNVGIGTTSPVKRLDVISSTNDSFDAIVVRPLNQTQNLNIGWQGIATSLNFILSTNGSERMRVDTSGNVGIGTTSPSSLLHVAAANDRAALRLQNTAAAKVWEIVPSVPGITNAGLSIFNVTDGTVPLYVSDGGNVGIGTTSPMYTLHVNGSVAGTSAYVNLSDERYKKDILPIENALNKVLSLNGVTFNWNKEFNIETNLDDNNHIGLLAQDVEKIIPQAVSTGTDENETKSVAYSDLVPVLIEAIKEQQKQIEELKRLINK